MRLGGRPGTQAPQSVSRASAHLLYALPNGNYFECDQDPLPWREEIVRQPVLTMSDGMIVPSDRPGLGVDVDEQCLARWIVKS